MKRKRKPTKEEICIMCHLSSECDGCCKKCKQTCNAKQYCGNDGTDQTERLQAWTEIVLEQKLNEVMKHNIELYKKIIN